MYHALPIAPSSPYHLYPYPPHTLGPVISLTHRAIWCRVRSEYMSYKLHTTTAEWSSPLNSLQQPHTWRCINYRSNAPSHPNLMTHHMALLNRRSVARKIHTWRSRASEDWMPDRKAGRSWKSTAYWTLKNTLLNTRVKPDSDCHIISPDEYPQVRGLLISNKRRLRSRGCLGKVKRDPKNLRWSTSHCMLEAQRQQHRGKRERRWERDGRLARDTP